MTVRIFHPSLDLGIFFLPGRIRETAQVVQVDRSSLCRTEIAPMSMSTDDDGHFFNDPTFSVKQSSPASTKSFDVCLFGWFRKSVNIVVCFQGFLSLIAEYSDSSSFSPSSSFFGRCCCRRRSASSLSPSSSLPSPSAASTFFQMTDGLSWEVD